MAEAAEAPALADPLDFDMDFGDVATLQMSPPPDKLPRRKAPAKAKAKGAGAKEQMEPQASGAHMPPKLCCICRSPGVPLCGKNLFCHGCKAEHEAMKKDANENGWIEKFEEGKADPVVFRKMVSYFRFECKSMGARPRAQAL